MENLLQPHEARVNVTYAGLNGDLPDPISVDASDAAIREMIAEALDSGAIPGIPATRYADLQNYIVDRFNPTEQRPYALVQLRPKTAFGRV